MIVTSAGVTMTPEQVRKAQQLAAGYRVSATIEDYRPDPSCGPGWIAGWVGGYKHAGKTLYVGIDPDGSSHS